MKPMLTILLLGLFLACSEQQELSSVNSANWEKRSVKKINGPLMSGSTYLSVYSQIYNMTEHRTYDLTVTVSMRNPNRADTVYIEKAEYFDTKGTLIRTYFSKPIYLAPLETVEIVIDEADKEGGTGANFLFDWKTTAASIEPLFEGVMISTYGQQGLSFTTQGKRIR